MPPFSQSPSPSRKKVFSFYRSEPEEKLRDNKFRFYCPDEESTAHTTATVTTSSLTCPNGSSEQVKDTLTTSFSSHESHIDYIEKMVTESLSKSEESISTKGDSDESQSYFSDHEHGPRAKSRGAHFPECIDDEYSREELFTVESNCSEVNMPKLTSNLVAFPTEDTPNSKISKEYNGLTDYDQTDSERKHHFSKAASNDSENHCSEEEPSSLLEKSRRNQSIVRSSKTKKSDPCLGLEIGVKADRKPPKEEALALLTSTLISKHLSLEEQKQIGTKVLADKMYKCREYTLPVDLFCDDNLCKACGMPKLMKDGQLQPCIVCPELRKKIANKNSFGSKMLKKKRKDQRRKQQRTNEEEKRTKKDDVGHSCNADNGEADDTRKRPQETVRGCSLNLPEKEKFHNSSHPNQSFRKHENFNDENIQHFEMSNPLSDHKIAKYNTPLSLYSEQTNGQEVNHAFLPFSIYQQRKRSSFDDMKTEKTEIVAALSYLMDDAQIEQSFSYDDMDYLLDDAMVILMQLEAHGLPLNFYSLLQSPPQDISYDCSA